MLHLDVPANKFVVPKCLMNFYHVLQCSYIIIVYAFKSISKLCDCCLAGDLVSLTDIYTSYMSPPAGDIYCFSLRVCASVRPFVCNAFLSEPDLQETFVQKICKKFQK